MPIYEFACRGCGQSFDKLVRSASAVDEVSCPTCHSQEVRKKLSTFATTVKGSASNARSTGTSGCATGGT